jgi:glycosyltransferase 2 family protein
VPYRIAALASFTSYSIGHNLGATVLTGGVVRLRIYSPWGLGVIDIAKIAFVTGLTFWLGNAFILGLSMAYDPEAASAIDQLPPWLNRTVALVGLATIVGYVLWLLPAPRAVGSGGWRITLPDARLTFIQIGIGVLDLTIGALAMYVLLPAEPAIDFLTLLVTYVLATLLGFLSHAPGSLGVFDAALLLGLAHFDRNEAIASLLVFRLLYFILPFFAALCALSARELWLSLTKSGNSDPPLLPPG